MPQPTDKSDAQTLPDPDLNPLLNPLLAANMGRWAEVYFTSPPEKRGEAVAQLLRELENGSSPNHSHSQLVDPKTRQEIQSPGRIESETDARELPQFYSEAQVEVGTCPACSYENPVGQKFCGMCGEELPLPEAEQGPGTAETAPVAESDWNEAQPATQENSFEHVAPVGYEDERSIDADRFHERGEIRHTAWQMAEDDVPSFAVEPESVQYRYRVYIGTVLAILLGVLVYMAWRGTTAFTGGMQSAPARAIPAAPAPEPEPTAQQTHGSEGVLPTSAAPDSPAATAKAAPQQPSRAENIPPESDAPPRPAAGIAPPKAEARKEPRVAARPSRRATPATANPPSAAAGQSGQEELASAEKYLNGGLGTGREAAPWLWKAVAKGNLTATMTLSDLYLRGNGVAKNCDQARLLLDAAARKGSSAAAQRLRNLPAFGCQ